MAEHKITVIIPVKNEESTIKILLDSLLTQTKKSDEIIITDGGSSDHTKNIIERYINNGFPIKLLCLENAYPGGGRNLSIQNAQFEIIASIDAGCRPNNKWLEELSSPFEFDPTIDVVFGHWIPDSKTLLEKCIVSVTVPTNNRPSVACMAFRKGILNKIGGFPENLRTHEDAIFINKLKKFNCKILNNHNAVIYWRPRSSIPSFIKQWYEYSKGIGNINIMLGFHLRKVLFYIITIYMITLGFTNSSIFYLFAGCSFIFWTYFTVKNHLKWFRAIKSKALAYLILPLIVFCRDTTAILGFIHGFCQRISNPKKFKYNN